MTNATMKTITTDDAILAVKSGDIVHSYSNGTVSIYKVDTVRFKGRCNNLHVKSHGHAYAGLSCFFPDPVKMTTRVSLSMSIESDAYINGQGYPTHDQHGNRISGYEITTP